VVIWFILASDDFKSIIFYIISLSEISHKKENGINKHLRGMGYATGIVWLGTQWRAIVNWEINHLLL
jgi:hypothetical protein